ncbi:MAG: pantoate--beta-alanine ligase [Rickettsiales bacterium]
MRLCRNDQELRAALDKASTSRAFVPTMGALHEGHATLMREARKRADCVVVSAFVNPKQFAPHEDFSSYPRTERSDLETMEKEGVDVAYFPSERDVYPSGFDTRIAPGATAASMEGKVRPHFFEGVLTVVMALFMQVRPSCAIFGEKDYQQLALVRRMAVDFRLGIDVVGVPIARDPISGLALSSRNRYLTPPELVVAGKFARIVEKTACALFGVSDAQKIRQIINDATNDMTDAGTARPDYVDLRSERSLTPFDAYPSGEPMRLFAAAKIGTVRILDNRTVERDA